MISENTKKAIGKLLAIGDDARVIITKNETTRFVQKSCVENTWKETFRDVIGGEILNDQFNQYEVIFKAGEHYYINVVIAGNKVVDYFWEHIKDEDVFRIDIRKCPVKSNMQKSFIIARDITADEPGQTVRAIRGY